MVWKGPVTWAPGDRGNKINGGEGMSHVLGQVSHWADDGNW